MLANDDDGETVVLASAASRSPGSGSSTDEDWTPQWVDEDWIPQWIDEDEWIPQWIDEDKECMPVQLNRFAEQQVWKEILQAEQRRLADLQKDILERDGLLLERRREVLCLWEAKKELDDEKSLKSAIQQRIKVSEIELELAQQRFQEMHSKVLDVCRQMPAPAEQRSAATATSALGLAASAFVDADGGEGAAASSSAGPVAAAVGSVTEELGAEQTLSFRQRADAALYEGCGPIPGALPALHAEIFAQKGVNVAEVCDILMRTTTAKGAASAYAVFLGELEGITFDAKTGIIALKKAKDAIRVTAVLRCACERDPRNMDEFLTDLWNAFKVMLDKPEVWQEHDGCITSGETVFQAQMSVDEAKARCATLRGCNGFTCEDGGQFATEGGPEGVPVMVHFKTFKESKGPKIKIGFQGKHWTSYTWKVPDLWTQLKGSYHKDIDQSNMNRSNSQVEADERFRGEKRPRRDGEAPQPPTVAAEAWTASPPPQAAEQQQQQQQQQPVATEESWTWGAAWWLPPGAGATPAAAAAATAAATAEAAQDGAPAGPEDLRDIDGGGGRGRGRDRDRDGGARREGAEGGRVEDASSTSPEHERPPRCKDTSGYCDLPDIKIETLLLNCGAARDDSRGQRPLLSASKPAIWRSMKVLLQVLHAIPRNGTRELETIVKCVMPTKYEIDGVSYCLAPVFEQVLRGTYRWGSPALAPLPAEVVERPLYVQV